MAEASKRMKDMKGDCSCHYFGVQYQSHLNRSNFFQKTISSRAKSLEQLHSEIGQLREEIRTIRGVLISLIPPTLQSPNPTTLDLLEELLKLILAKAEENASLKEEMNQYRQQVKELLKSSEAVWRSQVEEIQQSKYHPQVLFQLGKEVKTINEFSSNHLSHKQSSSNCLSKSSSLNPSFKELMALSKKGRMSIDRTIYFDKGLVSPTVTPVWALQRTKWNPWIGQITQKGKINKRFDCLRKLITIIMLILRKAQLIRSIPIYYRSLWKAKGQQIDFKSKSQIKVVQMENYFRTRLKDASFECTNIIKELTNSEIKQKRVQAMIEDWLNPQADSTRCVKPNDLIMLFVALEFQSSENLKKYRKLILDHLLEIDIQELKLQERGFKAMMNAIQDYQPLSKSHGRSESWKLILLRTAANAHRLSSNILVRLLPYTLATSQNNQLLKISNLLQSELIPIISSTNLKHKEIEDLFKMCYRYGFEKKEYADQLISYFIQSQRQKKELSFEHIINFYRFFPPFVQISEGLTYKSMLLNNILQLTQKNLSLVTSTQASVFCFSMLKHLLSEFIIGLEHQTDGQISYINQKTLKDAIIPSLPQLFWKIYELFAEAVNSNSITNHLIQTCYSSQYKQTLLTSERKKPYADTEMILQINQVLAELRVNFTRQQAIAGRYADFYLQNNIILQIDGSHHFSIRELQINEDTLFRNAHFILSKYRVVSLNVYEYNLARSLPQLRQLIQSKFDLLESKRAVMVY